MNDRSPGTSSTAAPSRRPAATSSRSSRAAHRRVGVGRRAAAGGPAVVAAAAGRALRRVDAHGADEPQRAACLPQRCVADRWPDLIKSRRRRVQRDPRPRRARSPSTAGCGLRWLPERRLDARGAARRRHLGRRTSTPQKQPRPRPERDIAVAAAALRRVERGGAARASLGGDFNIRDPYVAGSTASARPRRRPRLRARLSRRADAQVLDPRPLQRPPAGCVQISLAAADALDELGEERSASSFATWQVPAASWPPPPYSSISAPTSTGDVRSMIDLPTAKTVFCCLRPHRTWTETRALREQRVDHEAVRRVDDLLARGGRARRRRRATRGAGADLAGRPGGRARGTARRARRRRACRGSRRPTSRCTWSISCIISW